MFCFHLSHILIVIIFSQQISKTHDSAKLEEKDFFLSIFQDLEIDLLKQNINFIQAEIEMENFNQLLIFIKNKWYRKVQKSKNNYNNPWNFEIIIIYKIKKKISRVPQKSFNECNVINSLISKETFFKTIVLWNLKMKHYHYFNLAILFFILFHWFLR